MDAALQPSGAVLLSWLWGETEAQSYAWAWPGECREMEDLVREQTFSEASQDG